MTQNADSLIARGFKAELWQNSRTGQEAWIWRKRDTDRVGLDASLNIVTITELLDQGFSFKNQDVPELKVACI